MTGTIVAIKEQGYGFIKPDDRKFGKDIFFHLDELEDALLPFDERLMEQAVEFTLDESSGRPRAVDVRPAR
jgi:cold shock CspA family protein